MCIILPCADPTVPGVYWRENDRWVQYPAALAQKILEASRNRGQKQGSLLQLGTLVSATYPRGDAYAVNIDSMKQRNARTQYERDVKIVPEDDDTASNAALQVICQLHPPSLFVMPLIAEYDAQHLNDVSNPQ